MIIKNHFILKMRTFYDTSSCNIICYNKVHVDSLMRFLSYFRNVQLLNLFTPNAFCEILAYFRIKLTYLLLY